MAVVSENRTVTSVEARRALLRCFKHCQADWRARRS